MEITKEKLKEICDEAFFEGYKTGIEIMIDQTSKLGKQNMSGYVMGKIREEMVK